MPDSLETAFSICLASMPNAFAYFSVADIPLLRLLTPSLIKKLVSSKNLCVLDKYRLTRVWIVTCIRLEASQSF